MSTTLPLFDGAEHLAPPAESPKPANPCVSLYGRGPEGATCKGCLHLVSVNGGSRNFWKCDLRKITHGKATDHRVRWPACGRYEKAERQRVEVVWP